MKLEGFVEDWVKTYQEKTTEKGSLIINVECAQKKRITSKKNIYHCEEPFLFFPVKYQQGCQILRL